MKNILIIATQPQRFLDQVNFARNLANEANEFMIYFFDPKVLEYVPKGEFFDLPSVQSSIKCRMI